MDRPAERVKFRLLAALSLVGSLMVGAGCRAADAQPQAMGPMPVGLLELVPKPIADADEYLASLSSRRSLTLYAQVTGYVSAIRVRPGTTVKKGQLLIEIDPRQAAATLRSLMATEATRTADLTFAVRSESAGRELAREGVVSQLEYEQRVAQRAAAEAQVAAAQAEVQAQAQLLAFHRISAPTDGVLGDVPVKLGDYVTQQTRLTSIDQSNLVEAYVYVPVEKIEDLQAGSSIALTRYDGSALCEERPSFVAREVSVDTQSVLVKIVCENAGDLRTAQVLKARVIWKRKPGLTVPTAVVTRLAGQHFVFVARQARQGLIAKQVPVRLGDIQENEYVVLGGLAPGDRVVSSNVQKLRDGMPIAAAPPNPAPSR